MRSGWSMMVTLLLTGAAGCGGDETETMAPPSTLPDYRPGEVIPSGRDVSVRGWLDLRGVVHAHSPYSHDACDGEPVDPQSGAINEQCYEDLREGICATAHDFVMLTDHDDLFADYEFPDVLLYRAGRGDELVERGGQPVASWLACPDGEPALIMAGTESGAMPVGLEHHVGATPEERNAAYNDVTNEGIEALKQAGAVALVQHTEEWSVAELSGLPLDGFEMYNLHANFITGAGGVFDISGKLNEPELLPHSDLVYLAFVNEDARYLERWAGTLSSGARRVTTMATDSHRNALPSLLPDGERIDSFRRFMRWLSNHLLVEADGAGSYDDAALKEALRAGRAWGSFDAFGYPEGFDFHALEGGAVREMGAEVALSEGVELVVELPQLVGLGPNDAEPEIRLRLLKAQGESWQEIASSADRLVETITEPGPYRAEVRIRPRHLAPFLASYVDLAEKEFVWIYSNAIYIVD